MDYFAWSTEGDDEDKSLCFAKGRLNEGRILLDEPSRGRQLPGFLGNKYGMIILSAAGLQVIRDVCGESSIKVTPFVLCEPDGTPIRDDYVIVEAKKVLACLHPTSGDYLHKFVLAEDALKDAPHLFKLKEETYYHLFSRELGRAFNKANVTNVWGRQLPVKGGQAKKLEPKAPRPKEPPPKKLDPKEVAIWRVSDDAPKLVGVKGVERWRIAKVTSYGYFDFQGWPKRVTASIAGGAPAKLPLVLSYRGFPVVSEELKDFLGPQIAPLAIEIRDGKKRWKYFLAYPANGTYCIDTAKSVIGWRNAKSHDVMLSIDKLVLRPSNLPEAAQVFFAVDLPDTVFVKKPFFEAAQNRFPELVASPVGKYRWKGAMPAADALARVKEAAKAAGLLAGEVVAAAEAGDFDEWPADERGLERAQAAIERGDVRVSVHGALATFVHGPGVDELPGPVLHRAIAGRRPAVTHWLLAFERGSGAFDYRLERARHAWADTVVRPSIPAGGRNATAQRLARAFPRSAGRWALKGDLGMTGILRTTVPIAVSPEAVARAAMTDA